MDGTPRSCVIFGILVLCSVFSTSLWTRGIPVVVEHWVKGCCLTFWNAIAKSEWKSESAMGECGELGC